MAKIKKKIKKIKKIKILKSKNKKALKPKKALFKKLKAKNLKRLPKPKAGKAKISKTPKISPVKLSKKETLLQSKAEKVIAKGRERGFVTYDEILKEFPTIETDIMFLDQLYEKLSTAGIDVLEGGGILNIETEVTEGKKYSYYFSGGGYVSIQMYLKEIGQYPLLNAAQERDFAKRI